MKRPKAIFASRSRAFGCGLAAVGLGLAMALVYLADTPATPRPSPPVVKTAVELTKTEALVALTASSAPLKDPETFPISTKPQAAARFEGSPLPGHEVTLVGDDSQGIDLKHHWVQIQGPRVLVEKPDEGRTRLILPQANARLEFLLIVSNAQGVDTTSLSIPVGPERATAAPAEPDLKADAGDDLAGIAGRQITLNASRSEPRGKVAYRWIPTAGPRVGLKIDEGCYYSFVPTEPGIYKFALVVARGEQISEPDTMTVAVGSTLSLGMNAPTPVAGHDRPETTEAIARGVLSAVDGGPAAAEELATAFDGIAGRMDLYRTYADAYQEIARRVEAAVPADPARRAAWGERVFAPLTVRLIDRMRPAGVDLTRAEGQSAQLGEAQKQLLAEQFRAMAEGFRAAGPGVR